ncbi:RNA-dependent RNA polymerase [Mycena kentingensis (nom. inval.)]|nr:RNA-dependent RNA polymerase [Mycena kentingensis (nom. inval.)]
MLAEVVHYPVTDSTLSLPSDHVRRKLLEWMADPDNCRVRVLGQKIKFERYHGKEATSKRDCILLSKTPYVDPNVERLHQAKLDQLDKALRVDVVQFGAYYREYPARPTGRVPSRRFSVEWERKYYNDGSDTHRFPGVPGGVAWLRFEYDHKRILGDENTEYVGSLVIITFQSIAKLAIGYDGPIPYICFDTLTPPILEGIKFHRTLTGNPEFDNRHAKIRIGSLESGHERVSPYAHHVRLMLYSDPARKTIEVFHKLCLDAGFPRTILISVPDLSPIEACKKGFFEPRRLYKLETLFKKMEWPVVFQLEALLHNGCLTTDEIDAFLPKIQKLVKNKGGNYVGRFLQRFREALGIKLLQESTADCYERVLERFAEHFLTLQAGAHNCCHITITPTRMILDGPFPVQSNRVIRQYKDYEHNFIRVDFRDEDKLQYRWARDVDGSYFVRERVGKILKEGLEIGGRTFEFLAYSTSALRGHAVWFMYPFEDATGTLVNSHSIRQSLGNFAGTKLLKSPSKYAARLAQAFTATDPSVRIARHEWEEVPDLIVAGHEHDEKPAAKHVHTDGVGTISRRLADRIWHALCYKGVVSVDHQLDNHPKGIHMRLRPSMKKFDSDETQKKIAEIEIAMAFASPMTAYLNRPLVMALEDRGVRRDDLMELQEDEVRNARTIDDGIAQFRSILQNHGLGRPFRLAFILDKLEKLGLDLKANKRMPAIDDPWLRELRQVAMNDVLRDIKHSARIKIPESYLLVGVADEGPAYLQEGFDNVYTLPPGKIYACIQRPEDDEPTWLEGSCTISRSPIVHLGDIQRVQAIGKPPEGMLCSFDGLKNVVVLPSTAAASDRAPRSLASCLGGGDLDVQIGICIRFNSSSSDLYCVINYAPLLPTSQNEPASYPDGETFTLDRDSTVEDIADFVVEYINSDVLGLLSDRLLIIADQSKEGMNDGNCQKLAALCSQAVDYPKQGIAVDLNANPLPKLLLRCKPDWHSAEVISPRPTDYYTSDKALGRMFRAITLDEIVQHQQGPPGIAAPNGHTTRRNPLSNPIYSTLLLHIEQTLERAMPVGDAPAPLAIPTLFRKYVDELRYITTTHTLTNEANKSLLESEIVIGTILAKSNQKRWRSDCIYRCRYHTQALVDDVQRRLWKKRDGNGNDLPLKEEDLERAWHAYGHGLSREAEFGAKSFALLALGTVLDWLEVKRLQVTRPHE